MPYLVLLLRVIATTSLTALLLMTLLAPSVSASEPTINLRAFGGGFVKVWLNSSSRISFTNELAIKVRYVMIGSGILRISVYYENVSTYLPLLTYEEVRASRDYARVLCLSNGSKHVVLESNLEGIDHVVILTLSRNKTSVTVDMDQGESNCNIAVSKGLVISVSLRSTSPFSQGCEVRIYYLSIMRDGSEVPIKELGWEKLTVGRASATLYSDHVVAQQAPAYGAPYVTLATAALAGGVLVAVIVIRRIRLRHSSI